MTTPGRTPWGTASGLAGAALLVLAPLAAASPSHAAAAPERAVPAPWAASAHAVAGAAAAPAHEGHRRATVTQAGTYQSLSAGDFDGDVTVGALVGRGVIGLGTFDRLDGEAVVLAGRVFRVGTDGVPRGVASSRQTPFMQTVAFRPQRLRVVPSGTRCADLQPIVNRMAGSRAGIAAVRVQGRFRDLVTRSVPAQQPGATLNEAVARQRVFPLGATRATLVGFRSGPDLAGLSPAGVHLHGMTVDGRHGGHVLSCVVASATIEVQSLDGITVVLR